MARTIGNKSKLAKGEGRQIIIYGAPFAGKTTYLADPNCKVLLGDMDHNTTPLDHADNVDIFPIDSFEDYLEFKNSVKRGYFMIDKEKIPCEGYDVVALDSFTRFEELVKKYVATSYAPNRKRDISPDRFGAQSDWDDLQKIEVQEIREWQSLTRTMGFNSVWLGHDMAMREDPNAESRVTRIMLALQGKFASPRIMGAVDAILYFDKKTTKEGIQRVIYTQQQGVIQTDVRLPVEKRLQLPGVIPVEKMPLSKILPYLGWKKAEGVEA